MEIRIINIPPGEAPEHVRAAWIGVVLPLAAPGARSIETVGVLSRPKTRLGLVSARLFGRTTHLSGYVVEAHRAVEILATRAPDAATWWRENCPFSIQPGELFVFPAEVCQEIAHRMSIEIPEQYRRARAAITFDGVSIGFDSLDLVPAGDLEAAQLGYGIVPEGQESDWQPNWVVIGHEGRCGDPIFIDTNDEHFPVYTAAHGMGEWDPELIASSFQNLVQILQRFQALARGRENPILLDKNPLSDTERDEFLEWIESENPDLDSDFWDQLCGAYDE